MNKYEYLQSKVRRSSIPRLAREEVERVEIVLPRYDIQKKIADTLDKFDAICSDLGIGLPAEIEARQKQYEFYRDLLLSFPDSSQNVKVEREREPEQSVKA